MAHEKFRLDGESCTAETVAGGIQVTCGNSFKDLLTNGEDGDTGPQGESCAGKIVSNGIEITCGGVVVGTVLNGTNGMSIEWLGSLSTAPDSPTLNQAFYNSALNTSFIFDGMEWDTLVAPPTVTNSGSMVIYHKSFTYNKSWSGYDGAWLSFDIPITLPVPIIIVDYSITSVSSGSWGGAWCGAPGFNKSITTSIITSSPPTNYKVCSTAGQYQYAYHTSTTIDFWYEKVMYVEE